jgi:hypothetical protein
MEKENLIPTIIGVAISYSFTLLKHYLFESKSTSNVENRERVKEIQEKNRRKLHTSLAVNTLNLLIIPMCTLVFNICKSLKQEDVLSLDDLKEPMFYNRQLETIDLYECKPGQGHGNWSEHIPRSITPD